MPTSSPGWRAPQAPPPPDIAPALAQIAAGHGPDSIAATHAPQGEAGLRRIVCGLLAASLHINALSLFWTLVQVARQPDLLVRLRAEAEALPGGPSRVADAPLAFACIREAQRLRPAMAFIERQTTRPLEIDGYRLADGATVLFSPWFAGRDPEAWDDPARFDPERFAPGRRLTPGAYIPFGAGPRICPGANLVNQQLTFALSRLAGRLDLAPEAGGRPGDLIPIFRINLEPRGPVRLTARRRKP